MNLVFFLKSVPTASVKALAWPAGTELIALDPGAHRCGGSDPLCSTAYSGLWQSLRDGSGRALPNLLKKYSKGRPVERVAFVGFSAAHGFLNPLANNDADRADIDAYILLDASFGGGKTGYAKFVRDAAAGKRLLVTTTANTGGDDSWLGVMAESGVDPSPTRAKPPMPTPSGGVFRSRDFWWYRFVDAKKQSELPHWEQHHVLTQILEAHLVPYLRGGLGWPAYAALGAAVGAAGAWWWQRRSA